MPFEQHRATECQPYRIVSCGINQKLNNIGGTLEDQRCEPCPEGEEQTATNHTFKLCVDTTTTIPAGKLTGERTTTTTTPQANSNKSRSDLATTFAPDDGEDLPAEASVASKKTPYWLIAVIAALIIIIICVVVCCRGKNAKQPEGMYDDNGTPRNASAAATNPRAIEAPEGGGTVVLSPVSSFDNPAFNRTGSANGGYVADNYPTGETYDALPPATGQNYDEHPAPNGNSSAADGYMTPVVAPVQTPYGTDGAGYLDISVEPQVEHAADSGLWNKTYGGVDLFEEDDLYDQTPVGVGGDNGGAEMYDTASPLNVGGATEAMYDDNGTPLDAGGIDAGSAELMYGTAVPSIGGDGMYAMASSTNNGVEPLYDTAAPSSGGTPIAPADAYGTDPDAMYDTAAPSSSELMYDTAASSAVSAAIKQEYSEYAASPSDVNEALYDTNTVAHLMGLDGDDDLDC
jgi:hypothetical protein